MALRQPGLDQVRSLLGADAVEMLVRWNEPRSVYAAEIVRWRNFCSIEHLDDMITLLAPVFYMLNYI